MLAKFADKFIWTNNLTRDGDQIGHIFRKTFLEPLAAGIICPFQPGKIPIMKDLVCKSISPNALVVLIRFVIAIDETLAKGVPSFI